jgi:hypothetical protein
MTWKNEKADAAREPPHYWYQGMALFAEASENKGDVSDDAACGKANQAESNSPKE